MPRITKKQREEIVAHEKKLIVMKFRAEKREYEENNLELKQNDFEKYWIGVEILDEKEAAEVHQLYQIHELPSPYQSKYDMIERGGMVAWKQYDREH
jgi:hypothetical protein